MAINNYQGRQNAAIGAAQGSAAGLTANANRLSGVADAYMPLMQSLAAYGVERPLDDYAAQAAIDTQKNFENTQGQWERNLSRMGVNPNSGRFAGLTDKYNRYKAAAITGAMNLARQQGEQNNLQRLLAIAGFGSNMMGQANSALGAAANIHFGAADRWGDIAEGFGSWGSYKANRDTTILSSAQQAQGVMQKEQDARAAAINNYVTPSPGVHYGSPGGYVH